MLQEETIVLPTARAIRHRQLEGSEETLFLPNYITMGEFIKKLALVDDFLLLDKETRTLLLLEAADFEAFSNLQIERNFFTFTKNSSYIFKFYEELAAEMQSIEALQKIDAADVYGEYTEHTAILKELYRRYEAICKREKLLDGIFIPKYYKINAAYLRELQNVRIEVAGYLSNFELHLLREATAFCSVELLVEMTPFNTKMRQKLGELGFENLEQNYHYRLSLSTKEILSKEPLREMAEVKAYGLSEELLQYAFVKQKVYEYVQKGYAPEKIAVILPNEQAAQKLRLFDEKTNFNFAMGRSFSESEIYRHIEAVCSYLDDTTEQNRARLQRFGGDLYTLIAPHYHTRLSEFDFVGLVKEIAAFIQNKEAKKIFDATFFAFEKILLYLQDMPLRSVLMLLMQRLREQSFDDVGGGKITVMGVLETRSIEFDAVVIIDFDEANVPKRSQKDMFLNTKVREFANLPTALERENLQKHYYYRVLTHVKEAAISYVASEQSGPSRFLKELGIQEEPTPFEPFYAELLFERKNILPSNKEQEIVEPYSFRGVKLSASRLKTFLSCKRKYYYRYVKKINEHTIPADMPAEHEIGQDIHKALELLYAQKSHFESFEALQRALHQKLESVAKSSELDRYLMALYKQKLNAFCRTEIAHFDAGWRVSGVEETLSTHFCGMEIIGQIDRIDMRGSEVGVLDYKTGKIKLSTEKNYAQATDFQLEFYEILASTRGEVGLCAFYDLQEGVMVPEMFLQEKKERLREHIEELLTIEELEFSKCQESSECLFCPYRIMCGRA